MPEARQRFTMRLHSMIDNHVFVLVDSGANSSFIDADLTELLQCKTKETTLACFVDANGAPLTSTCCLPNVTWLGQGYYLCCVMI
jgi:hypothetical protein